MYMIDLHVYDDLHEHLCVDFNLQNTTRLVHRESFFPEK